MAIVHYIDSLLDVVLVLRKLSELEKRKAGRTGNSSGPYRQNNFYVSIIGHARLGILTRFNVPLSIELISSSF